MEITLKIEFDTNKKRTAEDTAASLRSVLIAALSLQPIDYRIDFEIGPLR